MIAKRFSLCSASQMLQIFNEKLSAGKKNMNQIKKRKENRNECKM